ncbi:putative transcriptional regulator [Pseudomonas aeruginosa]|nr:putative transcriptional regulator [Pseudomonas aeruginosa]
MVGAARRMHLSPPAMSRTLSRIREAVGDPIMVRAGRKLVPTPRALELQEQVRQLVDQARDLFNTRETIQLDKLERCFTLRSNNTLVGGLSIRLLEIFAEEAPRCTLRFVQESDIDDEALRQNRIDLYIGASSWMEPRSRPSSCSPPASSAWPARAPDLRRRDHSAAVRRFSAYRRLASWPQPWTAGPGPGRTRPEARRQADQPDLPLGDLRPARLRPAAADRRAFPVAGQPTGPGPAPVRHPGAVEDRDGGPGLASTLRQRSRAPLVPANDQADLRGSAERSPSAAWLQLKQMHKMH